LYPRRISGEEWRREEIKKGREGEEWNGENKTPPNLNKTVDQLQNSTKLYSILLLYEYSKRFRPAQLSVEGGACILSVITAESHEYTEVSFDVTSTKNN